MPVMEERKLTDAQMERKFSDDQMEKMFAGMAIAVAGAIKEVQPVQRKGQTLLAMLGVGVALLVPIGGWTMSLSNRVAVLESKQDNPTATTVEIAKLNQAFLDFERRYDQDRINDRVVAAREGK